MEQLRHEDQVPCANLRFDLDANPESLRLLQDLRARFGDICRVPAQTRAQAGLVIHDPEDIRRVLLVNRANYAKGVGLERVRLLLGNGLIVSDGEFWTRQRRMVQPLFHSSVLRGFSGLILHHNLELVERWARHAESGKAINLTRELSRVTLAIVLRALFSADLERLIQARGENPFELLTHDSQRDLAFAARFRALTALVREMIAVRRRENRVENDFLSMLMQARDRDGVTPMGERALLDELMTLIVAGHETTASALNWGWYLISQHPAAEARLQAAADAAPERPGVAEASAVECVEQLLLETLRLYPPVWLFSRRALASDRLGGYPVAAGTDIFICPYLLHRDPRHWPQPEEFRPQRFAAPESAARHRFVFLPFSAGPRHCVGEGFAMAEMAIHLIVIARRFRLKYVGSVTPEADFQINLRTRQDLWMQVLPR